MTTNMKSLNGYGFDATLLGGFAASEYAKKTDIPDNTGVDLLTVYPVGSIYMSVNSASPASLFGGTWEQLQDRFLLAAGSNYSAGSTGGESTHKLTSSEMPSHYHDSYLLGLNGSVVAPAYYAVFNQDAYTYKYENTTSNTLDVAATEKTGGSEAHNNMPPYLAVYMWKRVS